MLTLQIPVCLQREKVSAVNLASTSQMQAVHGVCGLCVQKISRLLRPFLETQSRTCRPCALKLRVKIIHFQIDLSDWMGVMNDKDQGPTTRSSFREAAEMQLTTLPSGPIPTTTSPFQFLMLLDGILV